MPLFASTRFVVRPPGQEIPDASVFWQILGIPPHLLSLFVQYDPIFDADGTLWINGQDEPDSSLAHKVVSMVMAVVRLDPFVENRWQSVYRSGQQMTRALLLGLDSLVARTLADPRIKNEYLHGWDRATFEVRYLACVSCLSMAPMDKLLTKLMEDDRALLHFEQWQAELSADMDALYDLPAYIFERLSVFLRCDDMEGTSDQMFLHMRTEQLDFSRGRLGLSFESHRTA